LGSIFAVGAPRRILGASAGILALFLVAMLRLASSAHATELLYWDNFGADPTTSLSPTSTAPGAVCSTSAAPNSSLPKAWRTTR